MSFVRRCPALEKLCPSAAVNLRVKSRKCRSFTRLFILMPAFRLDWIFMEIRALLLWPNYYTAHNNLGTLLEDGEEHFRKAIAINPYYAKAYYNLASLYV
ncbi:TPR_REGION domain-containing protein [Caerostris extrusa]|uniref:TPR_REGION domain-containing protein n=1 Tax=Caerostris extrusa TaxID=172846 RepID=A0AAV4SI32_CAEEX|nr:TPR_REGION domain-containing protein [Caerostris extrusa]